MTFHRLGLVNKNQRGFTLGELMIALAISGVITGGVTMTIFQVVTGSARTNNHMIAVRQVQNAGYWVSHDAQMAQQDPVIVTNGGELKSITLTWTDWETKDVHTVVYSLLADNKLQREHVTKNVGGVVIGDEVAIVAEYINPDPGKTKCEFTDGALIFTVTASIGAGSQQQSETRVYKIVPRPG
jgi:prepilin-type N-terminal cleavage/methylation domain-containing protein